MERLRKTHTNGQIDRQKKKTDRQLGIQSDEWTTDRLMHRQSNQLMDGKTYGLMDEQIDEWLNGWTDARIKGQRDILGPLDIQIDGQTNGQTMNRLTKGHQKDEWMDEQTDK